MDHNINFHKLKAIRYGRKVAVYDGKQHIRPALFMLTAGNDPGHWVSTPSCLQQSLGTHLQLHQFASSWPCNVFTAKFKPAKTMWTMIE